MCVFWYSKYHSLLSRILPRSKRCFLDNSFIYILCYFFIKNGLIVQGKTCFQFWQVLAVKSGNRQRKKTWGLENGVPYTYVRVYVRTYVRTYVHTHSVRTYGTAFSNPQVRTAERYIFFFRIYSQNYKQICTSSINPLLIKISTKYR